MSRRFLMILSFFMGTILFNCNNVYALDNGWNIENGFTYYYENSEICKGLKEIDGKWYHFGENSGQLKIGDSKTLDGRVYYSDKSGEIQTEWYSNNNYRYYSTIETGAYKGIHEIDGKWYHFGENSGQLKIGDSKTLDGRIYYSDKKGVIQTEWYSNNNYRYYSTIETGAYKGIHEIDEKWYHFGENSGQLKIGDSKTLDGRIYYSDKNGVIQTEWYSNNNYRYYSTIETGAYKGIHEIDEKWYHFGENSGQLKIGDSKTLDGRIYYSDKNGVIQTEWYSNSNYRYYSTIETGAYKGIVEIDEKWYHFGENSGQLKIGDSKTLDGRIYYSDKNGVIQTEWYLNNEHSYYSTIETGAYKGIHEIDEKWYHFGENSGQLKIGDSKTLDGRIYYSDKNGVIQTEWYLNNEHSYYSTIETGAYKGIHEIDGKWYHFGENSGQLKFGWSMTFSKKYYYSDENGILQNGNILIDGNWYFFNDDYSLRTGWQEINDTLCYIENNNVYYVEKEEQEKSVLYDKINDKLVTGIYKDSNNNIRYLNKDGNFVTGWVLYNDNVYYIDNNFIVVTGERTIDNEVCIFDENGIYQKKQYIPKYYTQTDSRWAKKKYGIRTLKATGCAPTSMAMAFTSIKNYTILPTDVADYLYYHTNEYNRYTIGSSGLAIVYATDYYKIKRTPINTIDEIKIALARGKIVFAAMGEGKFGTKSWNHAIILYNYQNGMAFALDPLKDNNNGWFSINQLIKEQSKDPDDSRGGSNFYMLG